MEAGWHFDARLSKQAEIKLWSHQCATWIISPCFPGTLLLASYTIVSLCLLQVHHFSPHPQLILCFVFCVKLKRHSGPNLVWKSYAFPGNYGGRNLCPWNLFHGGVSFFPTFLFCYFNQDFMASSLCISRGGGRERWLVQFMHSSFLTVPCEFSVGYNVRLEAVLYPDPNLAHPGPWMIPNNASFTRKPGWSSAQSSVYAAKWYADVAPINCSAFHIETLLIIF